MHIVFRTRCAFGICPSFVALFALCFNLPACVCSVNAFTIWKRRQTIDMLKINMYFRWQCLCPNVIRNVPRGKQTALGFCWAVGSSFSVRDNYTQMDSSKFRWGGRNSSLFRCETSKLCSKMKSKISLEDATRSVNQYPIFCSNLLMRLNLSCWLHCHISNMDIMWCHLRHRIRPLIHISSAELLLILTCWVFKASNANRRPKYLPNDYPFFSHTRYMLFTDAISSREFRLDVVTISE